MLSAPPSVPLPPVALVHDYLTQRGGAERVALVMARAFPDAPLYTSLYEPTLTFPEFGDVDVRTLPLDRLGVLRRHHRLAFPLLAPCFSRQRIDAPVTLCSTSGWSHGVRATQRKIVLCYAPARWLYQPDRYLGVASSADTNAEKLRRMAAAIALRTMGPSLRRWDRQVASGADCYLATSSAVAAMVRDAYGIEAPVLHPPPALTAGGTEREVAGIEPGYLLCVSRLLPYKNVDKIVEAATRHPGFRLVVVGDGPERQALLRRATSSTRFLGVVDDPTLRWLYRNCRALVAASYEDYGLTPLEAASFGRPSIVLRAGGFLDTVDEGRTGLFFDRATAEDVQRAVTEFDGCRWSEEAITRHADRFSEETFVAQLRRLVQEWLPSRGVVTT